MTKPNFTPADCVISTTGTRVNTINYNLAVRQGIDRDTVLELVETHKHKNVLYEKMKATDDVLRLRDLAKEVTDLLFKQQALWNFPQDENFHAFWELPKCTCPKMDNRERQGTKYTVIDSTCPIHGN